MGKKIVDVTAMVRDALRACSTAWSWPFPSDFPPSLLHLAIDFVSHPLTTLKMPFFYWNSVCTASFKTYCLCKWWLGIRFHLASESSWVSFSLLFIIFFSQCIQNVKMEKWKGRYLFKLLWAGSRGEIVAFFVSISIFRFRLFCWWQPTRFVFSSTRGGTEMDHSTLHFQLRVDKKILTFLKPEIPRQCWISEFVCVQLVFGHRDMDARKCHCPK